MFNTISLKLRFTSWLKVIDFNIQFMKVFIHLYKEPSWYKMIVSDIRINCGLNLH